MSVCFVLFFFHSEKEQFPVSCLHKFFTSYFNLPVGYVLSEVRCYFTLLGVLREAQDLLLYYAKPIIHFSVLSLHSNLKAFMNQWDKTKQVVKG